ncbi:hypothetical protein LTR70_001350 [Exophiala xenobiotica]|uniref:C2H2-type domain-containing protein n=1 Tax=Lithohypha guttulata TaxID=1690604 RepID=A0ABR0KMK9_9EURO|nr:hypothetical protein LTR24_000895 [Lithohypha guttulata]KAK5328029.1 hypothetical protein LTR70_001350 [Exophiala xenobiotica]
MSSTGRSTQAGANTEMKQEGEVKESNVGTGEAASQAVNQVPQGGLPGISSLAAEHLRIVRAPTTCSAYLPNIPAPQRLNMRDYNPRPRYNEPSLLDAHAPTFVPANVEVQSPARYGAPAQSDTPLTYGGPAYDAVGAQYDRPEGANIWYNPSQYGVGSQYGGGLQGGGIPQYVAGPQYVAPSGYGDLFQQENPVQYGGPADVPRFGATNAASRFSQSLQYTSPGSTESLASCNGHVVRMWCEICSTRFRSCGEVGHGPGRHCYWCVQRAPGSGR